MIARPKLRRWLCIAATGVAGRPRGRPKAPGAASAASPELLPSSAANSWRQYTSGSNGAAGQHSGASSRSSGSGGGGGRDARSAPQRRPPPPQRLVQRRLPLRQQVLECRSAAELHRVLWAELSAVTAADVPFLWQQSAARGFFGQGQGQGGPSQAAIGLHALLTQLAERHLAAMTPVALSTTAWACALSELPSEGLMEQLAEQAERCIFSFQPKELCMLMWASALAAPTSLRLLKACSMLLERGMSLELFTPHDLSVLIWCCGKVQYSTVTLLDAATQQCVVQAGSFDPSSATRLLHGYAMLQFRPPGLIGPLLRRCKAKMDEFDAHDLSLLISSLGKLLCDPDIPFVHAASIRASQLISEARPEHLANMVWGFARLGYAPSAGRFLTKLSSHLGTHMPEYGPSLVASVLWAMAKLEYTPPVPLLNKALAFMTKEMSQQSTSTLATFLWALGMMTSESAKVSEQLGPKFRAFAQDVAQQLQNAGSTLSVQDSPSVLIAFATLQVHPPEPLARQLAEGCAEAADSLAGDALARMAWAAATLQLRDPKLLAALVEAPGAARLLPQGVAQLTWSLAALGVHAPDLMAALARSLCDTPIHPLAFDPIDPLDKARVLWAFAHLGIAHRELQERLLGSMRPADIPKMGPTGVAALLWACAKLKHALPGPLLDAAAQFVRSSTGAFSRPQLLQLAWSLTQLGLQDPAVLSSLASQFKGPRHSDHSSQSGQSSAPTWQPPRRRRMRERE